MEYTTKLSLLSVLLGVLRLSIENSMIVPAATSPELNPPEIVITLLEEEQERGYRLSTAVQMSEPSS